MVDSNIAHTQLHYVCAAIEIDKGDRNNLWQHNASKATWLCYAFMTVGSVMVHSGWVHCVGHRAIILNHLSVLFM